jgi:hypothetical protein
MSDCILTLSVNGNCFLAMFTNNEIGHVRINSVGKIGPETVSWSTAPSLLDTVFGDDGFFNLIHGILIRR